MTLRKKKLVLMELLKKQIMAVQVKTVKLQAFDSSYFRSKNHFENDDTKSYLLFQPVYRYFKKLAVA